MSVKVSIHPYLVPGATDLVSVEIAGGPTLGACIDELEKKTPGAKSRILGQSGDLAYCVFLLVNGEEAPEKLRQAVKDGDEIYVEYLTRGCC